jgi:hypothetical protein
MKIKGDCVFCSNPATTKEHIFPKWLQGHYGLYDQKLRAWTGMTINYRFALVPACEFCNGVRLSALEKRIQSDTATESDVYLWALKIRYCLSILDARLLINPRHPEEGFLLPPSMVKYKKEFILPALVSLDNPGFRFDPDPFGSVFMFEQKGDNKEHFGFADVPAPYWAFSIVLPGKKVLAVLFADRGVTKSLSLKMGIYDQLVAIAQELDSTIPQQLLFTLLRIQNQVKIPSGVLSITENEIISETLPNVLSVRKPKLKWYDEICEHLQISKITGNAAYAIDMKTAVDGFTLWRKRDESEIR